MVSLGIEEKQAFDICRKYNMLSPLYDMEISRDGCFFCPNAGVKERKMLEQEYPELVTAIYEIIAKTNCQTVLRCQYRNNWIKDYLKNNGEFKREEVQKDEHEKDAEVEGQMSIFDFLEENV